MHSIVKNRHHDMVKSHSCPADSLLLNDLMIVQKFGKVQVHFTVRNKSQAMIDLQRVQILSWFLAISSAIADKSSVLLLWSPNKVSAIADILDEGWSDEGYTWAVVHIGSEVTQNWHNVVSLTALCNMHCLHCLQNSTQQSKAACLWSWWWPLSI